MIAELATLGFFTTIILIIWIYLKFNIRKREIINTERMALIEKGVYDFPAEKLGNNLQKYLLGALIIIGLGIALIISAFIDNDMDILMGAAILLLPGLGILLFYVIQSKKEKGKIGTNS